MIRTQNGRALLRGYADDAQTILECALRYARSQDDFRAALRKWWMRRAQQYFDGRNNRHLYLNHRYSTDEISLFTNKEDMNIVSTRICLSFSNRNPPVTTAGLERILRIHGADYSNDHKSDIFLNYNKTGMSRAEYYLEDHIIQFYRILFFFQELRLKGIISNEDDVYNGLLPFDIVPNSVQAIVYDDNSYSKYLLTNRNTEKSANFYEEELLMLLTASVDKILRYTTPTSTSSTSTTAESTSTTIRHNKLSKKGSVCSNVFRKHFAKRPSQTSQQKSDTKNTKNAFDQKHQKNINGEYIRYTVDNDDPIELLFHKDKTSVFIKVLQGVLAAFGSSHHDELRRRR